MIDKNIFILLAMIFAHIIADYNLQGCLVDLKQKEWWENNIPDEHFTNPIDYIIALLLHGFSWSFCIFLAYYLLATNPIDYIFISVGIIANAFAHACVDHFKCNLYICSFWMDQMLHIYQIISSWYILINYM